MKIIKWTHWDDPNYINPYRTREQEYVVENIIIKELRKKGYRFTGDRHQNADFCVPVFDDGTVYQCTQREWGDIMARAYPEEFGDSDGYGYIFWTWIEPIPMIMPKPEDYEGE